MYELTCYAEVGQHCGAGTFPNRGKQMTANVKRLLKAEPELLMVEAVEYSETTGLATGETVIYHMTQAYIDRIESISKHVFADRAAYHQYMAAAYQCLRTGRAVTFRYH